MRDMGLVTFDEPFTKLLCQGMVLNEAFVSRNEKGGKEYHWAHDLDITRDDHGVVLSAKKKADGLAVEYEGWTTMSKSKNNGLDPAELIDKYGADTARLFMMFTSHPEQTLEWSDAGVEGSHRFLKRVWAFAAAARARVAAGASALAQAGVWKTAPDAVKKLRRAVHMDFKQADYDIQRIQYNTVVSGTMKMLNTLDDALKQPGAAADALLAEGSSMLVRLLYPVTPHLGHALWQDLGYAAVHGDILNAPWPQVDESALTLDTVELVLQVNGKVRGSVAVPATADKAEIERLALANEAALKHIGGNAVKKVVVVPGRLVNIVA
jgi:leucyl-tRNA synthetase